MAESSELGIANNTTYTFAHGLGAVPKLTQAVFRCKTAVAGFSVDQELPVTNWSNSGNSTIVAIWADNTNVYARINSSLGNNYVIPDVTGNAGIGMVYANWRIVLRAWY